MKRIVYDIYHEDRDKKLHYVETSENHELAMVIIKRKREIEYFIRSDGAFRPWFIKTRSIDEIPNFPKIIIEKTRELEFVATEY